MLFSAYFVLDFQYLFFTPSPSFSLTLSVSLSLSLSLSPSLPFSLYFNFQDIDNLRCDLRQCGDPTGSRGKSTVIPQDFTRVSYTLKSVLVAGQCFTNAARANGEYFHLLITKFLIYFIYVLRVYLYSFLFF